MTALQRYNANMEGEIEPDPIERLRFFLSLALTCQDWIDVEQFIDGVSNQLSSRDAEITELKSAAQAVVDRWDTPLWKDVPATAQYINGLRKAIAATKHHDRS